MKRVFRCTKFYFSRTRDSWVITILMLSFWTGGGARELVLETPNLVRSLVMSITTNFSKVIRKYVIFFYLNTYRWRCFQLWHVPSDHGVDEAYQVLFRLIKVWPRLQPPNQFWVDVVVQNIITFFFTSGQKIWFSKFCSSQAKDHLSQFWEELDRF